MFSSLRKEVTADQGVLEMESYQLSFCRSFILVGIKENAGKIFVRE